MGDSMKKQIIVMGGLLVLLLTIIFLPISIEAGNSVYFYQPYPQGYIGVNQPEIGWTVLLGNNEIESVEFLLNGEYIDVHYDELRETFYYNPKNSLKGQYEVKARISLKDWNNKLEKLWTFTISNSSLNSLPLPNQQQVLVLNLVNDYRYALENPIYRFDSSLNMSAQKHAEYQGRLNIISHYQEKGTQGFFGKTIADRAAFYGFYGDTSENISFISDPTEQKAVDQLFAAPYHRIPFLKPSYQYFGYGINKYYQVLNFGSKVKMEPKWVAYPGPDHDNVPIAWENYETPNPLRFYNNPPKRVGFPIMAGVYGKDIKNVTLISAELWDENGTKKPIYINSPKQTGGSDEHLTQEVIIVPKYQLDLSHKYKVRVILDVNVGNKTKRYDKTWFFTTESKIGQGKDILHLQVLYPPFITDANEVQLRLGQRYIFIDKIAYPLDVVPFIEKNRTMVPFRALGNSLGAKVDWDGASKKVLYKKEDMTIELPINSNIAIVNGKKISLDQGAIIRDSRSYVPTRFISEQLGAYVKWLSNEQEVLIQLD